MTREWKELPAGLAAGLAAGGLLWAVFGELRVLDLVQYRTLAELGAWWNFLPVCVLLMVFFPLLKQQKAVSVFSPLYAALVVLPFCRGSFAVIPLAFAALGWSALRCDFPLPSVVLKEKYVFPCAVSAGVFWTVWGFWQQKCACDSAYLCYADWGEYAESYMSLLRTGGSWSAWCFSGGHWNPLPTGVMTAAFWLLPLPETLFAVNAGLLGSSVPLGYWLARKNQLPCETALLCALLFLFSPVLSNQLLCLFYGYHPVNFAVPLLLGFFIFRQTGNWKGMALCFALSLLVQETIPVLWSGYALWLAARKKYRSGAGLFLFSLAVFLLLSRLQPGGYTQLDRFAHLGKTLPELLFSWLLHPGAFLTALFSRVNALFLLMLFLPVFFAAAAFPERVLILLPGLAALLLQLYPERKMILSQNALEPALLLLILTILALGDLRAGKSSRLLGWLRCGSSQAFQSAAQYHAALAAACVTTLCGYFMAGQSMFWGVRPFWGSAKKMGEYSFRPIGARPDARAVREYLCKMIPPDARILASTRPRAFFCMSHATGQPYAPRKTGDILVLDVDDIFPNTRLRGELFADPHCQLLTFVNSRQLRFLVYRITAGPVQKPPFLRFDSAGFDRLPGAGSLSTSHFTVKGVSCEKKSYLFAVRLDKKPEAGREPELEFTISSNGNKKIVSLLFAHGYLPADQAPRGCWFFARLPGGERLQAVREISR